MEQKLEQQDQETQEVPQDIQSQQPTPTKNTGSKISKKMQAIMDSVETQNVEIPEPESLDHHLSSDNNQDDIEDNFDDVDNSEGDHEPEDSSIIADNMVSDDQEIQDPKDNKKGEIPQWGKDNPERWGKYKERQKEKEYEAKMRDQEEKLHQHYQNMYAQQLQAPNNNSAAPEIENNIITDPRTGIQLDIRSPAGQALIGELELGNVRNNAIKNHEYNEYMQLKNSQERILAEQIEEAKFKYKDYEDVVINKGAKFTEQMIDMAAMMDHNDASHLSNSRKLNGADFLYYLGKNPAELERVRNLNKYAQYSALMKHVIDFNNRVPKKSKAPEPSKPLVNSNSTSSKGSSFENAKAMIRARNKFNNNYKR